MTPEDVEAVLQGRDGGVAGQLPSTADEQGKVKFLQDVFVDVEKAWAARDSGVVKAYAEKLAIGSRQDENRDRVVKANAIPNIIHFSADRTLRPFAITVLYNIMVDYAPAQNQASNSKLSSKLIDLLSGPNLDDVLPLVDLISKTLNLIATQESEATNADPKTPAVLLSLATSPEIEDEAEDFLSLVSVAQEYLTHASLQTAFVSAGSMPLFLSAFEIAHSSRFDSSTLDDTKLSNQAAIVRKILINALSDITDNPAFAQTHPISSPIFRQLGDWLNAANPALQSAACLALGNLARDDDSALSLVSSYTVHMPVVKLLADPSNTNTLLIHSALGFLKNLAIPHRTSASSAPPSSLRASSLASGPWKPCPSAADAVTVAAAVPTPALTNLHNLLALFRRTDDPAKMEAARAVLRVGRYQRYSPEAAADSNDSEALAAEVMQAGAEQAAVDAGVAQPPPAAKAPNGSKRADQENSLIIAWNLIQGAKSEVLNEAAVEVAETQPVRQISEFEDLVNKAGSLLSSEAKENNVEAS
ncbi:unnamed protein product [Parascedosporium putredinis]|uniref:ARM repeat-containing protein n=1 Tax=Parascedosporium putredinis TaxID=1442378 RepID=A0A9P1GZY6_9PEZI|nr:unnamed protein product [Parascedosporium putredinis]CAI7992269.1 unnamed protein product [Parascedosporium putredinis]